MTWTTIIFEYLAIGIMTCSWITLIILRAENITIQVARAWASESAGNIGVIMLALVAAYSVGMVVDKVLHVISERLILQGRVRRLWRVHFGEMPVHKKIGTYFYAAEDAMNAASEGELGRLQRRRGRIRMLRALIVNVPLIILGAAFHYLSMWLFIVGLVFEFAVVIAFLDAHHEYIRMVARKARALNASASTLEVRIPVVR